MTGSTMDSLLPRLQHRVLVRPDDVLPTQDEFQVIGTFNPGVAPANGEVVLLVRVAERPKGRAGWVGLPRWCEGRLVTDWVPETEVQWIDPRVVRLRATGQVRLTFASHLRVARSADGLHVDGWGTARLVPQSPWEEYGIEDPRITRLEDRYWVSYVAVSRFGVATALASTRDFESFQRHGIIFAPENKDVVLLPERVEGRFVAIHRPAPATPLGPPGMWLAFSADLTHWGGHQPLVWPLGQWESARTGAGPPPLRTREGWLLVYHGVAPGQGPGAVGRYQAGALILATDNPAQIVRQSRGPILAPQSEEEQRGFVPGVVFPTGLVDRGETLLVYYGAADTCTAVVEWSRRDLEAALEPTASATSRARAPHARPSA